MTPRTERLRAAIKALLPKSPPPGGIVTIERGSWLVAVNVSDLTTFVIGFGPVDPQGMVFSRAGTPMGRLGVDLPGTVHDADELIDLLEGGEGRRAA